MKRRLYQVKEVTKINICNETASYKTFTFTGYNGSIMPTKGITLFFLLLLPFLGSSQNAEIDELVSSLEVAADDTAKVNRFVKLATLLGASEYSRALYYLQEAQSLAERLNYKKGIGDAYFFRSRVYYYKDEYPIAIEYLNKSREIYERIPSKSGLADYYFGLGEVESLYGNYVEAMEAYQQAIKLEEQTGDIRGVSICLNSLAGVHIDQKNYIIAMEYARKALRLKKEIKDKRGISSVMTGIGRIYEETYKPDSALIYYQEALQLRRGLNDSRRIAGSLFSIGGLYLKRDELSNAIDHLAEALSLFEDLEEKTGVVMVLLKLSEAYNQSGATQAGFEEANNALKIARETDNQNLIKDCYQHLSEVYAANGMFQQAHSCQQQFQRLNDSLFSSEKSRVFNELEMKYQAERKDSEIKLLKSKNEIQQKNIIILILSVGVLLALAASLIYFYRLKSLSLKNKSGLLEKEQIIHQKDNELKDRENKLLQEQLESKNKALTAKVLGILQTNEALENIVTKMESLTQHLDDKHRATKEITLIINELERHSENNLWEEFDKAFRGVHSEFYTHLLDKCPSLTPTEIKIAALLRLNLSTKEIAAITFKSESGIKSARFRLRKKLDLASDAGLVSFLMGI